MGKTRFFGREAELSQLDGLWEKRVPSLVTCRGRRRIGKSTLIEEFARRSGARFVKLEGLRPKAGMTDAEVGEIAAKYLKRFHDIRFEVSRLRAEWLADRAFE